MASTPAMPLPLMELPVERDTTPEPAPAPPLTREAVERLIQASYPGLRTLIRRRVANAETAADLLSEAICIAWEKWQNGRIARSEQIAGYIFQVAMNLLRNHSREIGERADRRAPVAALEQLTTGADAAEQSVEDSIARNVRSVLLAMSSQRDRELLKRFYLDEEDKDAICASLGLTTLQFDKVLHRARGRIRRQLEARGLGPRELLSILMVI